eukprot:TRINITY_DN3366_c0_g1_i2.p1 TRINITY_DN3366_c0_g1~~TRINITY_DN3366_c0_g1_i2.p1  ORF type:complete len:148 (-),score=24.45 TRINITY_DN3366_c0_g1_i2:319-762(-)
MRSYKEIPMEGSMTDMELMSRYQYLVIGLHSGYLSACKYLTNLSLLFSVKAHLKPVVTLCLHPAYDNMVMSGAADGFIKIWNIDKQSQAFSISLDYTISSIHFMREDGLFSYVKKKRLHVCCGLMARSENSNSSWTMCCLRIAPFWR